MTKKIAVFVPSIDINEALRWLAQRRNDMLEYDEIMRLVANPKCSTFQKEYDAFYRVRRNEAWRAKYFDLMAEMKARGNIGFEGILTR